MTLPLDDRRRFHLAFLIALAVAACLRLAAAADVVTVTTTADSGPGSLREAILSATPGTVIQFAVADGATITLTTGELALSADVTIQGPGADRLTISGNHASRIVRVNAGVTATINGLTLANGYGSDGRGGAIANAGVLSLHGVSILNSVAQGVAGEHGLRYRYAGGGGGGGGGGAIFNAASGALHIERSTLAGNVARGGAGGQGSIFSLASADFEEGGPGGGGGGFGGAIVNDGGNVELINSTLSANLAVGGVGAGYYEAFGDPRGGAGGAGYGDLGTRGATTSSQGVAGLTGGAAGVGGGGGGAAANGGNGGFGGGGGGGGGGISFPEESRFGGSGGFGGGAGAGIQRYNINGYAGFGGGVAYPSEWWGNGSGGGGGFGGAIFTRSGGRVALSFVTITGNRASGGGQNASNGWTYPGRVGGGGTGYGGGVFNHGGTIALANTIVAANTAGDNPDPDGDPNNGPDEYNFAAAAGTIASAGHNLFGCAGDLDPGGVGPTDLTGVNCESPLDPRLYTLGAYGGPTPTHALQPDSPALDAGSSNGGPATDQRGFPRVFGAAADIGAFEEDPNLRAIITQQPSSVNVCAGSTATFTVVADHALGYQWRRNGVALVDGTGISGASAASLTISDGQPGAMDVVDVVVEGAAMDAVSTPATLGFAVPPAISQQPQAATAPIGATATFIVAATAIQQLAIQWQESADGVGFADLPGATTATLTLTDLTRGRDGHQFRAVLSDGCGTAMTDAALLTVTKLTQTIDFDALQDRTYGDAPFVLAASASTGLPIAFSATGPATLAGTTLTIAGGGDIVVTASQSGDDTYAEASLDRSFHVSKATPSITWADPADIVYGTLLGPAQLNATAGIVDGTFTYGPAAGAKLAAGSNQLLSVMFAPTAIGNYLEAAAAARITVLKATPVVTWADPADIYANTPLGNDQLNATANLPGHFVYVNQGEFFPAGNGQILSVTFVPDDAANYTNATAQVRINVLKVPTTVTWSNPAPIVYGTPLDAVQLNATATAGLSGTLAYVPPGGVILGAGDHQALTVTFTPFDQNYATSTQTVYLDVLKATATITWQPQPVTYGQPLGFNQLNPSASVAGSFDYSPAAGTILTAGVHTLHATFTPVNMVNYQTVNVTADVSVSKASPQITWAPQAFDYPTPLGPTQLNASTGLPGSYSYDPPSGTVLDAGLSQPGTVTFTPADQLNYETVTVTRSFVVNQGRPVISGFTPQTITYGTPVGAGQLNAVANVPGAFSYSAAQGAIVNVPGNTIVATFTPSDSANYIAVQAQAFLTVNKAEQTLTWHAPAPIDFGTPLGSAQLSATVSVVGPSSAGSLGYLEGPSIVGSGSLLPVGTHTLTVTAFATQNYNEASASATLDVHKKTIGLTWNPPAPFEYGNALSSLQLQAQPVGAVPGFAPAIVYDPPAGTRLDAGRHVLTASVNPGGNYSADPVSVTVMVNKAPLYLYPWFHFRMVDDPPAPIPVDPDLGLIGLKDPIGVSFVSTAPAGAPAGYYKLTPVFTDPLGRIANYAVELTDDSFVVYNPVPTVGHVDPSVAVKGRGDLPITIVGDGFVDATLWWNDVAIPTTFVSRQEIHATIPAALLGERGMVWIYLTNPEPSFGGSFAKEYFITDSPTTVASVVSGGAWDDPFHLETGSAGEDPNTLFVDTPSGEGAITIATFTGNPGGAFAGADHFFDVFVPPGSTFTELTITTCSLANPTDVVFWFNGTAWVAASNQAPVAGPPACVQVTVNDHTAPTIAQLAGAYFATAPPPASGDRTPPTTTASARSEGDAYAFGTWTDRAVVVTLQADDAAGGSGVASLQLSAAGAGTFADTTIPRRHATIRITADGETTLLFHAVDHAGNVEATHTVVVRIDRGKPELVVPERTLVEATGPGGALVTFAVSAHDALDPSPVVACAPASGTWFPLGRTIVACTATDRAGNVDRGSFAVVVRDTTPPVIATITPTIGAVTNQMFPVTLAVSVTDLVDASPVCRIGPVSGDEAGARARKDDDDGNGWSAGPLTLTLKADDGDGHALNYAIEVRCRDDAGNKAAATVTIAAPAAAPPPKPKKK